MDVIRFTPEGWRARLDTDFDDKSVARVADGLGALWSEISPAGHIYVGYDTRKNAQHMAQLAAEVVASWGLDVRLSTRACPLPALAYSCMQDPLALGALMLTASGAPAEYQGVVLRNGIGQIPDEDDIEALEALIPAVAPTVRGTFRSYDVVSPYKRMLLSAVNTAAISAARPTVVVDPLYGAGQGILAEVLREAGAQVYEIHTEPTPDFAGLHPRPIDPWLDDCEREVIARAAWAGFALDGDGDRLGVIDANGACISPHRHNPLIVKHLAADKNQTGRVIMQMNGSNYLRKLCEQRALPLSRVPIGFTNCYREFGRDDALIACGEMGGLAFLQVMPERDGSLAALMLCEMMVERGKTMTELVDELEAELGHWEYAQQDLTLDVAQIQTLRNILPGLNPPEVAGQKPTQVSHADGLRLEFADTSWLLIRPSRTRPLVRIYAEAPTKVARDALLVAARELCNTDEWH